MKISRLSVITVLTGLAVACGGDSSPSPVGPTPTNDPIVVTLRLEFGRPAAAGQLTTSRPRGQTGFDELKTPSEVQLLIFFG